MAGDVDTEIGGLRDTVALISRATVMEVAISKTDQSQKKRVDEIKFWWCSTVICTVRLEWYLGLGA